MTANVQTCGAPANLAANAISQTQINLSWTDTTTTESGFRIERSPNGATGWIKVGTAAANSTSYANTGLSCGTTYYYRVKSYARSDSQASSVPAQPPPCARRLPQVT